VKLASHYYLVDEAVSEEFGCHLSRGLPCVGRHQRIVMRFAIVARVVG
jgi:hypothetical protein